MEGNRSMSRTREQRWLWGLLVLALVGLAMITALRGRQARLLGNAQPATAAGTAAGLADYGAVPHFELVAQTGDAVRLEDLLGRVWVADFIFTHCASTCPMMNAQMERLAHKLGPDVPVRMVSFSVDPERDTVARLAEYAEAYSADPQRWLFLTGEKPAIRELIKKGFHLSADDAAPEDVAQGAEPILHSTRFVLVDANGTIRGYYNGVDEEALDQLARDIEHLTSGPAL
jgi:cytochrome oxidase Cu insertion factor (SCO1/SenC/PrrC family)